MINFCSISIFFLLFVILFYFICGILETILISQFLLYLFFFHYSIHYLYINAIVQIYAQNVLFKSHIIFLIASLSNILKI